MKPPVCGEIRDGYTCELAGDHRCVPRGQRAVAFFRVLQHTKGRWARKRFELADWQREDIIVPLFATVTWNPDVGDYVRRYRIAWLELARKNGKSELLAGIALYLLVADKEEGAEIYGCARDRDQARKVYDVAERMVQLLPTAHRRKLQVFRQAKRIVYGSKASYYEIVSADAAGNLGHNPHGVVFDEVITQPDDGLWTSMRTAMGARSQPLMVAATTAGTEDNGFARRTHDEMLRIAEDPARAPHVFVYARNTPEAADPWDEKTWAHANPALGDFLSIQALRDEALEARADPAKENSFRQFRLNQWVSQASRWMPMHLWDSCTGEPWLDATWRREALAGRQAWAGFDLAAKMDLCAWCLLLPPSDVDEPVELLWRFWLPEEGLAKLDRVNDNRLTRWARDGWITVTEGAVVDYERVYADIAADAEHFTLRGADCDEWSMWPVIQRIADTAGLDVEGGELTAYRNTYDRMSPGMVEIMGLVRQGRLIHHGNPVARWCFEAAEVRKAPYDPNLLRPSKPERGSDSRRIDAVPTAAMAANAWRSRADQEPATSAYEDTGLMIV